MRKVIVFGAGPAGLFAAYELSNNGFEVIVVDKGKPALERHCPQLIEKSTCTSCRVCDVMHGSGGAGLFSDGKLGFTPILSMQHLFSLKTEKEVYGLLDYVDNIFTSLKVNREYYPKNNELVMHLQSLARQKGMNLLVKKLRHVGSDKLPGIIDNFEKVLAGNGVKFIFLTCVKELLVENRSVVGVELGNGKKLKADFVVCAPGRSGSSWLKRQAKKLGINTIFQPIWVGVRVEFPAEIMKHITDVMYEPFLQYQTNTFDDLVRSFCVCPNGFVAKETYDDFVCVNGFSSKDVKSENTNFALLCRVGLTEPVEDTISYGESIAKVATTIGGGKPVIQRLGDLRKGRRSTWSRINKSYVKPTLKDVTPGDISMALPSRVVTNIMETIKKFNMLIPGIDSKSTLLYAPEIKFSSALIETNEDLETSINGLFVAGDGAGVSGNIVGAAVTGIIAARGIISKTNK